MTEQLDLLNQVPTYVMDAIAWAETSNGEMTLMINGSHGAGTWLRENLEIKAVAVDGSQVAVKAKKPDWAGQLRCKAWAGSSGSNHPKNKINW
jgi:hypothetical protein